MKIMKIKLLGILALLGVSCDEVDRSGNKIIELYSGGTIVDIWEAKNIYRSGGSVYFTDVDCNCEVKIHGTFIITPRKEYTTTAQAGERLTRNNYDNINVTN